ncbi:hypothetical protein HDE_01936 [Halotydeus destructor]|nr:hypothetical protein HDE_01936 [Halotydeus destructor]
MKMNSPCSSSLSSSRSAACSSLSSRGLILVTLIVLVLSFVSLSSARYLPTRSDESRRERIKDLLRLILDLSDAEGEAATALSGQGLRGDSRPLLYELQSNGGSGVGGSRGLIAKRSLPSQPEML